MLSKDTKARLISAMARVEAANEIESKIEEGITLGKSDFNHKFADQSVNQSMTKLGIDDELVFLTDKRNTAQVAGNFNGGGTGNKAIAGIKLYQSVVGKNLADLDFQLAIEQEVELRSKDDADEKKIGVSYNLLIDLQGNGNVADYKVLNITNSLNGVIDKWGETGASASVDEFNIQRFEVLPGYVSGEKAKFLKNHFYVVGGLASYVVGTNLRTQSIVDNSWPGIPVNLDVLLNGGTMPLTGAQFSFGYPNAKVISVISFDGGHPAAEKMAALSAQVGDSSTNLRVITAVTSLKINSQKII